MYQILNVIGGKSRLLHDQRDRTYRVLDARLQLVLNKSGSLTFQMPDSHPEYAFIQKLRSSIRVLEDGKLIFEGRVLSDESNFYNVKSITCEGSLGYLQDSLLRPFSVTGTILEFLKLVLDKHNEQVEERKQILIGRVTVADDQNERKRELERVDTTWNTLKELILDVHGGYLWIEYRDEKLYLNYTYDYGGINPQPIRFGVNLLDLTKYQDATNVFTCLIPYGADVEYTDEVGESQSKTIDITSVNDGKDYLTADQETLDRLGKIWATYQWMDVTDPAALKEKAKTLLEEAVSIPDSLKITAVDLNYTGVDIQRIRLGYYTTIISKPHDLKKDLLTTQMDLYLDDPAKGSITLGSAAQSFTGSTTNRQVTISKTVQQTAEKLTNEIQRKIENASALITGGLGGYVVIDNIDPTTGKKSHPWRILIMNTPDKKTATNVIQINQNGIGFSTSGINGPYRNAWTIDGNLVADFVTAGTMLADRIRGGTLEVGGPGLAKNGVIRVLKVDGKEVCRLDQNGVSITDGVLNGPEIRGGFADFGDGLFYADSTSVSVGGFEARYDWGRDIFQSADEQCGLSANPNKKGSLWMWAGWQGADEYDFAVNNEGLCVARDFKCLDRQDFWKGWGLTDTLEDVYNRLDELQDQIDNIDTGGD